MWVATLNTLTFTAENLTSFLTLLKVSHPLGIVHLRAIAQRAAISSADTRPVFPEHLKSRTHT